ncbi:hypothetical protein KIS4809_0661 [Bacillus sp. ZZV12-4809]|nr:hypothetical protein KIS4809_0661 [Bacillus sp. ZZV12-4809]
MQKFLCAKTSAVKPVHHYVDRLFYISGTSRFQVSSLYF